MKTTISVAHTDIVITAPVAGIEIVDSANMGAPTILTEIDVVLTVFHDSRIRQFIYGNLKHTYFFLIRCWSPA